MATYNESILDRLKSVVGTDNVVGNQEALRLVSSDLFTQSKCQPIAIIQPRSVTDISRALSATQDMDVSWVVRGGGMSYTQGYLPSTDRVVLIDMSGLNAVISVDQENLVACVEASCTWVALDNALNATNLVVDIKAPISGVVSTIGGAVSQAIPGNLEGILCVELVLADGTIVTTGSAGIDGGPGGFCRTFGPDLTGLFIGDCGAFGVKTRIWLRLRPKPSHVGFASFAFENWFAVADAMAAVSRLPGRFQLMALDQVKTTAETKVTIWEGLGTLVGIVKASRNPFRGLMQALRIALAGQTFADRAPCSLHITTEASDQHGVRELHKKLRLACGQGSEISPSIPTALHSKPYSIRGFLGPKGERWVPIHGIFPISRRKAVLTAINSFFEDRRVLLQNHDIHHTMILSSQAGSAWLIEPMFYWHDALLPLHKQHLDERRRDKYGDAEANQDAYQVVSQLRADLIALMAQLGAVTLQLGKSYAYLSRLSPGTANLARRIKSILDPNGGLSAGNLELG